MFLLDIAVIAAVSAAAFYIDSSIAIFGVSSSSIYLFIFSNILLILCCIAASGVYESNITRNGITTLSRIFISFAMVFIVISMLSFTGMIAWGGPVLAVYAMIFGLLWANRLILSRVLDLTFLTRRLFVIGDEPFVSRMIDAAAQTNDFVVVDTLPLATLDGRNTADLENLVERISRLRTTDLVLAAKERRGRIPFDFLFLIRSIGIRVVEYEELYEEITGRVDLDAVRPGWFIFHEGFERSHLDHLVKRLFDIVAAGTIIVLTVPLMALTAIAIWIDDGFPIFYVQERTGKGGIPFRLIKFRTMRRNAEEAGPRFADDNDPRVTRIGSFLRRFRIDELPQLFNVLKGEMSIVGPRPERPEFVRTFRELLPWFEQRHRVKPGLAGWAQLHAPYAYDLETTRLKLAYDLYYLRHWSLLLDVTILIRTFQVVIWGTGVR